MEADYKAFEDCTDADHKVEPAIVDIIIRLSSTAVFLTAYVALVSRFNHLINGINKVVLRVWLLYSFLRILKACLEIYDIGYLNGIVLSSIKYWVVKLGYLLFVCVILRLEKVLIYMR